MTLAVLPWRVTTTMAHTRRSRDRLLDVGSAANEVPQELGDFGVLVHGG